MKKIMFNDHFGLTDAVLQGRKTMTRRILDYEKYKKTWDDMCRLGTPCFDTFDDFLIKRKAKYKVGEVVAVAQSYKSVFEESLNYAIPRYHWLDDHIDEKGYANKMFVKAGEMPHQIRITDLKVERLQDVSEDDCLKEGIQECFPYIDRDPNDKVRTFQYFKDGKIRHRISPASKCFAYLIDDISGKGTWESNPYVFAISFERFK